MQAICRSNPFLTGGRNYPKGESVEMCLAAPTQHRQRNRADAAAATRSTATAAATPTRAATSCVSWHRLWSSLGSAAHSATHITLLSGETWHTLHRRQPAKVHVLIRPDVRVPWKLQINGIVALFVWKAHFLHVIVDSLSLSIVWVTMGKQKKTRKFAVAQKKLISAKDTRM